MARMVALHALPGTRFSRTSGVLPISSVMSLAICKHACGGKYKCRCAEEVTVVGRSALGAKQ